MSNASSSSPSSLLDLEKKSESDGLIDPQITPQMEIPIDFQIDSAPVSVEAINLEEDLPPQIITLVSKEGSCIPLPRHICAQSKVLQAALDLDPTASSIPIKGVEADVLSRVIDYLVYHDKHEFPEYQKPIKSTNMSEVVGQWDAAFIDQLSIPNLFRVVLTANYMDIPSLLQLGCCKLATLIKGNKPEDLRKIFHIEEIKQQQ